MCDQNLMTREQEEAGTWSKFDDVQVTISWRVIKFCSHVIEFWWHASKRKLVC